MDLIGSSQEHAGPLRTCFTSEYEFSEFLWVSLSSNNLTCLIEGAIGSSSEMMRSRVEICGLESCQIIAVTKVLFSSNLNPT